MKKLQLQSTAYLLLQELPSEMISKFEQHPYHDVTDLVKKIESEKLEDWQYCYINYYKPEDQSIPEYILETITEDDIIHTAEELLQSNKPKVKESNPFTRSEEVVEAAGSREEFCETQIDFFRESCIRSIQPTLIQLLREYTDDPEQVTDTKAYEIAKELTEIIGLWRWYLLTKQSGEEIQPNQEQDKNQIKKYNAVQTNEWILSEARHDLLDLLEKYDLAESIDLLELSQELRNYEEFQQ